MNTQTDQVQGHAQSVSSIVAGDDGQPAELAAGMVAIAGVHGVLAPFAYPQEQITRGMGAMLSPDGAHVELIEKIHAATGVRSRTWPSSWPSTPISTTSAPRTTCSSGSAWTWVSRPSAAPWTKRA